MAKCRDCKLYDLDAVKNKAGAVLRNRAGKCLWQSTEVWPVSVAECHNRRPTPHYMQPDDGDRCQRFIKREGSA
jgi:hypothetical protein